MYEWCDHQHNMFQSVTNTKAMIPEQSVRILNFKQNLISK